MRIAWRYSRDVDHAKDIVQESFVRIFHALDSFDDDKASLATWMKSICIREAIGFLRKYKKFNFTDEISENLLSSEDSLYETGWEKEELLNKMESLPEEHKTILMMYYFDELSHKEIAALLNIKEVSSRSRLLRAREILKIRWKVALTF
jgi:RNA polymerase sigma-70 factor (ECF subfamily)